MNVKKKTILESPALIQHPDYETEIMQILRSNFTPKIMRARILDYHENDIAAAMEEMSKEERKRFYSILDTTTLAQILE